MAAGHQLYGQVLRNHPNLQRFLIAANARPTRRPLGVGSFGSVEELEMSGVVCAGKKIHETLIEKGNCGAENIASKFVVECQLMSDLRHPHLVQFLGVCFLPNSTLPVIVMERLLTNLDDLLVCNPDIPLSLKRSILADVARGLVYLHSRSPPVIHRDLSARNVLLNSAMVAKISDLGNARIVNFQPGQLARTLSRIPGTMVYMPPEVSEATSRYGTSLDSFSFGHLSLFTITQVFPATLLPPKYRDPENPRRLLGRTEVQRREEYIKLLHQQLGERHPLVLLVEECLDDDPLRRRSAQDLLQLLEGMSDQIEDPYQYLTKLEAMRMLREKDKQDLHTQAEASGTSKLVAPQTRAHVQMEQLQLEHSSQLTAKNAEISTLRHEMERFQLEYYSQLTAKDEEITRLGQEMGRLQCEHSSQLAEKDAEISRIGEDLRRLQGHSEDVMEKHTGNCSFSVASTAAASVTPSLHSVISFLMGDRPVDENKDLHNLPIMDESYGSIPETGEKNVTAVDQLWQDDGALEWTPSTADVKEKYSPSMESVDASSVSLSPPHLSPSSFSLHHSATPLPLPPPTPPLLHSAIPLPLPPPTPPLLHSAIPLPLPPPTPPLLHSAIPLPLPPPTPPLLHSAIPLPLPPPKPPLLHSAIPLPLPPPTPRLLPPFTPRPVHSADPFVDEIEDPYSYFGSPYVEADVDQLSQDEDEPMYLEKYDEPAYEPIPAQLYNPPDSSAAPSDGTGGDSPLEKEPHTCIYDVPPCDQFYSPEAAENDATAVDEPRYKEVVPVWAPGTEVIGKYDCSGSDTEELSFKCGDTLTILRQTEFPQWYEARSNDGLEGLIPTTYVQEKHTCTCTRPKQPVTLQSMPWFHGEVSQKNAVKLLKPYRDGNFLVRDSNKSKGNYTLCVSFKNKVKHYHIQRKDQSAVTFGGQDFANLVKFVEHFHRDATGLCCRLQTPVEKKSDSIECTVSLQDFTERGWALPRNCLQTSDSFIRKGEFKEIWLGEHHGEKVAITMIKHTEKIFQQSLAEAAIMTTLKHPNLVSLVGVSLDGLFTCFITEYLAKGLLQDYLISRGRADISEQDQRNFAKDVCKGMVYLESQNLVHRSLAARHVHIGDGNKAKVSDFSLTRHVLSLSTKEEGKLLVKWTAPEALRERERKFSNKSDVWSFGILLWEIYSYGQIPYPGVQTNNKDVLAYVEQGKRMNAPDGCPGGIYEIMKDCWNVDATQRPDFIRIEKMLSL